MEQEPASFWTEIKKYEDTLAKDPNSYCFAPLAELYRKSGLLDDAITVAQRGVELHPDYVGGHMALGRAYFEKGMKAESRAALEKVVAANPDNLLAQKLLGQLYSDAGEAAAAERAFLKVLSLNPEDLESRIALESLQRTQAPVAEPEPGGGVFAEPEEGEPAGFAFAEPEVIEEAELLEELPEAEKLPELEEEDVYERFAFQEEGEDFLPPQKGPISTLTLAELYIAQGFLKRAMSVYRDLLEADPDNADLKGRIFELKRRIDEDNIKARRDALENIAVPEPRDMGKPSAEPAGQAESLPAAVPVASPLAILEAWLENIRRRRHVL